MQSSSFYPQDWLRQLKLPDPQSHKGQNGKLLLIGGSNLFHAASKWSLDIASKFVDMVFYASTPSNNELIKNAKQNFWNGIVIDRSEIPHYAKEADCILIGPGMERTTETTELVSELTAQFATKKWVIDAGALQMLSPKQLPTTAIITPHPGELLLWQEHGLPTMPDSHPLPPHSPAEYLSTWQNIYQTTQLPIPAATIIKGHIDLVIADDTYYEISGGNAGMTKGGTGDVLAGLVAALYCTNSAVVAALLGSYINKRAGDQLFQSVGPFFNASDLVSAIPETLWQELKIVAQP